MRGVWKKFPGGIREGMQVRSRPAMRVPTRSSGDETCIPFLPTLAAIDMEEITDQSESSPRVLLVDDDVAVLEALGRVLSRHFRVACAKSGEEGLLVLRQGEEFGVVISDQDMPGISGVDFLEQVGLEFPTTVRVMLTGLCDPGLAVEALHQGGIHRFLSKPCPPTEIIGAVASAVEVYESGQRSAIEVDELAFSHEGLIAFNHALEERVTHQRRSMHHMHRFAVELNQIQDLQGIVQASARVAHRILNGRGVHVQIWDPEEVAVEHSTGPEMSTEMHSEPLTTSGGQVGEIVIDDLDFARRRLTGSELDLLAAIASTTAVAAHNEFRRRELDDAQYATIVALARLSEQRDNETGKHLDRVSLYCRLIVEKLRHQERDAEVITDTYVRDLIHSAPLHDIGKVGIPDSILLKPGKLTPGEWEIMKTHAELGATTLQSVIVEKRGQSYLEMSRDIAWCHHEKWDGSGYPRQLKGEEIPLSARILALADVYDALTSVRPYKEAWTHEEALAWIVEGRGAHFDPAVVDAFHEARDEANEIRASLADCPDEVELKPILGPIRKRA